jgi:hypothetical protein
MLNILCGDQYLLCDWFQMCVLDITFFNVSYQDGVIVEMAKALDSFLDRASTTALFVPFLYSMV